MNRKLLAKHLVTLMFFMFLANTLATKFYWYYTIWYFDMPMHFLGGFWEGLFFIWFFSISGLWAPKWATDFSGWKLVYKTILYVLIIGISWEIFEFVVNNKIGGEPFNTLDTISDVFFDLAGGSYAVLYFLRNIMITDNNTIQ